MPKTESPKTLADRLLGSDRDDAANRRRLESLAAESARLIETQVAARRGIKGVGLKTALSMAKAAKPDILPLALRRLLPKFAEALEPLYRRYRESQRTDFAAFLDEHGDEATTAMLSVTDQANAQSQNRAIKSIYAHLRGGAQAEVRAFLPAFAALIATRIES